MREHISPSSRLRRKRRWLSHSSSCWPPSIVFCVILNYLICTTSSRDRSTSTAPCRLCAPCLLCENAFHGATWFRPSLSGGKSCRSYSHCSRWRAAASYRSSNWLHSPTCGSPVSPLAKLLEAALFASARPIPVSELADLDSESSP